MFFESDYKILSNEKIAKDVYKMKLEGDTSHITAPGQFINIKLDGKFLRRPISVCDCGENVITIIYKVVGDGTQQMAELEVGQMLNILTGLGNGYDITKSTKPLLIGGGVSSAKNVIEMMMAGATAVQVGAANLVNPYVCKDIIEALPTECEKLGIDKLSDIIGVID